MTTPSDLNIYQLIDTQNGRVTPRFYTDPDIYQLELERIFGRCNARRYTAVTKTQVAFDIEEELSNRAVGSGIHFAFQIKQIRLSAFCFRVNFRIRRHGDIEICHFF